MLNRETKKEQKKIRWTKRPLEPHQMYQHSHYRGPRWRREKGAENVFEDITAENFSNLGKETDFQVQESESQTGSTQRGPHQDKL